MRWAKCKPNWKRSAHPAESDLSGLTTIMADNPALKSLYPFLHGERQDAARLDAVLLESVRQKARDSQAVKEAFFNQYAVQVIEAARAVAQVYENGGRLFSMGNGG